MCALRAESETRYTIQRDAQQRVSCVCGLWGTGMSACVGLRCWLLFRSVVYVLRCYRSVQRLTEVVLSYGSHVIDTV